MPVFAQTCPVAFLFLPCPAQGVSTGLHSQPEIPADNRALRLEMKEMGLWGPRQRLCTVLGRWPGLQSVPRVGTGQPLSLGCLWASPSPWLCSLCSPSSDVLPVSPLGAQMWGPAGPSHGVWVGCGSTQSSTNPPTRQTVFSPRIPILSVSFSHPHFLPLLLPFFSLVPLPEGRVFSLSLSPSPHILRCPGPFPQIGPKLPGVALPPQLPCSITPATLHGQTPLQQR